jgi:hypothetical protein
MTILVDITSSNPTEFLPYLMTTAFHAKSSSPAEFLPSYDHYITFHTKSSSLAEFLPTSRR